MKPAALRPAEVISRVAAAIAGGYLFVWGFVTLGITASLGFGFRYGDAQTLAYLLAFLVFLAAILWAFAARSTARVWAVLAGGGALMTGAALLLGRGAG
jgi:hypothetical protein